MDFAHTLWLFDFDLTLYGFDEDEVLWSLDRNITRFLVHSLGFSPEEADARRREYCATFGTTLGGLSHLHGVTPEEYFDFIHQGKNLLKPRYNPIKRVMLENLPGEKWIFTNARTDWVLRGLDSMGLQNLFTRIVDVEYFEWRSKPDPEVYQRLSQEFEENHKQIIFLDDKLQNLIPASDAGWMTIWLQPKMPAELPLGVDICMQDLMDLPRFLPRLDELWRLRMIRS